MKVRHITRRTVNSLNNRTNPTVFLTNVIYIIIFVLIVNLYMTWNRFLVGTNINGINCSFCTAEQSAKRLQKENFKEVSFTFITSTGETNTYQPSREEIKQFDLSLSNLEELEKSLEEQQNDSSKRDFQITEDYYVNIAALREYLSCIPEMQEKNQVMPQNAHLRITEANKVEIVKEVVGNYLDLNLATSLVAEALESGEGVYDFSKSTAVYPEVLSTDEGLIQNQKEIEKLLKTVIEYRLGDGTVLRIDANTSKSWLKLDEETGQLFLSNYEVSKFVDKLYDMVEKTSDHFVFHATGIGDIIVPITDEVRTVQPDEIVQVKLNREITLREIIELIQTGLMYQLTPTYCDEHSENFMKSYIELDFARQKIWVYKYGVCIQEAKCVTGDVRKGRETPDGIYFLVSKSLDVILTDNATYWSHVDYWMKIIASRGIGFHDASWRDEAEFVPTTYLTDGSHGCINMLPKDAQELYQNIDSSMPVILYNSNECVRFIEPHAFSILYI